MRKVKRQYSAVPLAGAVLGVMSLGFSHAASGAVVIDGTLDAAYGSALATQTINTGFGDSTIGDGTSAGGSEIDALYANVAGGNLNLFISGNLEESGGTPNHLNIFIADGRAGQSVLNATGGPLNAANGLTFPTGFSATFAIDANDFSNSVYFDTFDLINNTSAFSGGISLTGGVGNGALSNGLNAAGINNTNVAGVNGSSGTAASAAAANAVTTGFEISIPLSALGNPTGSVKVIAAVNGGNDSFYSNQFLGGLPNGYGNLGSPSGVNLNGESAGVVVAVPEPTSLFAISVGGLLFLSRRRSRLA